MTYLIPDDWALNHGIAPGDARGPQPDPEPFPQWAGDQDGMWGGNASRGLKPRPPFRGYFGKPVSPPAYDHRTHSPFAVPDGLFTQGVVPLNKLHGEGVIGPVLPGYSGVQGLGWVATPRGLAPIPVMLVRRPGSTMRRIGRRVVADSIAMSLMGLGDATAGEVLQKAQSEMKQAALEGAAAQTALTIGLNFIPVVGTAVSIVLGVVMAIGNSVYRKKAQQVMSALEMDLNNLAASYQAKLQAVKMAVFEQEKNAGIQLALSGATLDGLGWLDGAGDVWRSTWKKVVSPVYHLDVLVKAIQKPVQAGLKTIQKITPNSVDRILQKPIDQMNRDQAELDRADATMNTKLATLSGEQQWIVAQERAGQAYAAASKDMEAQYQAAIVNLQSPQYRQALQVVLAKRIRSDPSMAALISTIGGTQAQSLVERVTGEVTNQYAAPGQPGAGIPIPQQTSTGERAAAAALPLIGAVVAFLALGRG